MYKEEIDSFGSQSAVLKRRVKKEPKATQIQSKVAQIESKVTQIQYRPPTYTGSSDIEQSSVTRQETRPSLEGSKLSELEKPEQRVKPLSKVVNDKPIGLKLPETPKLKTSGKSKELSSSLEQSSDSEDNYKRFVEPIIEVEPFSEESSSGKETNYKRLAVELSQPTPTSVIPISINERKHKKQHRTVSTANSTTPSSPVSETLPNAQEVTARVNNRYTKKGQHFKTYTTQVVEPQRENILNREQKNRQMGQSTQQQTILPPSEYIQNEHIYPLIDTEFMRQNDYKLNNGGFLDKLTGNNVTNDILSKIEQDDSPNFLNSFVMITAYMARCNNSVCDVGKHHKRHYNNVTKMVKKLASRISQKGGSVTQDYYSVGDDNKVTIRHRHRNTGGLLSPDWLKRDIKDGVSFASIDYRASRGIRMSQGWTKDRIC